MQARISQIISEYASQGDHRTGTAVDDLSADWLIGKIKSLGVEPSESAFPFQRVRPLKASLSVSGLKVSGIPLYDCHYTDGEGVSGSMGELGTNVDIGITMALPFASSENGQRIHAARQAAKHKAIIIVTDDRLPSDGPAILNVVAHCDYVDATARNIGARIRGRNPELPPLVVMTPRSGWWACASERGGGIACFLEMMRAVKESRPVRDVIFTANTGHELGHIGLDHYLSNNPDLIKGAFMWVHLGANFASRHGAEVRLQYSDQKAAISLAPWLQANSILPDTQTGEGERPLGEARNIYDGDGRYISILGRNGLFRQPA